MKNPRAEREKRGNSTYGRFYPTSLARFDSLTAVIW